VIVRLGVYIHFPWCRKLCPYCDFAVAVAIEPPHEAYLAALADELTARAADVPGRTLATIYLGGGTPSWWRPDCVARVIELVRARFPGEPAEVTIEANPTDCTPERLAAWRAAGVGRVSIGVQSTDPIELTALGRDHRHGDGPAAIAAARAAGMASVSADYILGVPTRGGDADPAAGERALANLAAIADLAPDHLSVYELTIEERTAFGKRARAGRLLPLAEDALATLYLAAHALLAERGYAHYEISSYARPGHRAIHNSRYWSGGEYLGLGAGAASFVRSPDGTARRWTNLRRVKDYLAAGPADRRGPVDDLAPADVETDLLWLAMRTSDGLPAARLAAYPALVERLVAEGLAVRVDDPAGERISPTPRGFLYADTVAARIVARGRVDGAGRVSSTR
jgi:putative oxygen-independent coproporphyrinogen III oxidase